MSPRHHLLHNKLIKFILTLDSQVKLFAWKTDDYVVYKVLHELCYELTHNGAKMNDVIIGKKLTRHHPEKRKCKREEEEDDGEEEEEEGDQQGDEDEDEQGEEQEGEEEEGEDQKMVIKLTTKCTRKHIIHFLKCVVHEFVKASKRFTGERPALEDIVRKTLDDLYIAIYKLHLE